MAGTVSPYARSYNSFSGVDIKAVAGNVVLSELQAISYSVTREKAPIYTMGSPDPRSFSRGKRGIAGTLVFIMFDRAVMINNLRNLQFQSDIDDIRPDFAAAATGSLSGNLSAVSGRDVGATVTGQESPLTSVGSDQALAHPWYADQIPPFDVTLAAANEYGALAVMRIFGCELLNEGYGVSIDDIVSEQQHTYVARQVIGWTPVNSPNLDLIASQ